MSLTKRKIASEILQSTIILTVIVYAIFAGYVPYKKAESHKGKENVAERKHNFANATYATVLFWFGVVILLAIQIARVYFNEFFSSRFIYKLLANLSRVLYSIPFFPFIMTDCFQTYCTESVSTFFFNADFMAGKVYVIEIAVFAILSIIFYICRKSSNDNASCESCLSCFALSIVLLIVGIIVIAIVLSVAGFAGTTKSLVISSLMTATFIIDLCFNTFFAEESKI